MNGAGKDCARFSPGKGENSPAAGGGRSVLKSAGLFAGSNLATMVMQIVGGVLASRSVEPAVLGQYNGIGLVSGYAPFLLAGVTSGLNRDLPYTLGQGNTARAQVLAAAAQWWSLLVGGFASIALILVGVWQAALGRLDLAAGWWSFSIVVFGVLFGQGYLQALFRTSDNFVTLARVNLAAGVFGLLSVALVWWLGWWGLCLRGMVVALLGLALMWQGRPLRVIPEFDGPALAVLVKTGLPIMAVGQAYLWWTTLNSTLVLRYAGTTALGLYAIANLTGPAVMLLTGALGQVIYPRMSEEFGRTGRVANIVRLAVEPTLLSVAATALAVATTWLALPLVVSLVLPRYANGIEAAQWSAVAAGVMAAAPVNNVFNVAKKQGRYGAAIAVGILSYLGALWYLLADGVDLTDFPKALLAGRIVFLVICLGLIVHMVTRET